MIKCDTLTPENKISFLPTDIGHYDFFFYNDNFCRIDGGYEEVKIEVGKTKWIIYTNVISSVLLRNLSMGVHLKKVQRLSSIRSLEGKDYDFLETSKENPKVKIEWVGNSAMVYPSKGYHKITIEF